MHYGTKKKGPFLLWWEWGEKHCFLTVGIGRMEIQLNFWPKKWGEDE